jgi:hypothetical protein
MTVDQVIAGYLEMRRRKEAMQEDHKLQLAPINDGITKLEGWLQGELQRLGLTNFKGASGIAFLQTATKCTSEDWDATLKWIIETGAYEFLEKRVSKSVVQEYMEQHGEAPPGVSVTRETEVRVRKS